MAIEISEQSGDDYTRHRFVCRKIFRCKKIDGENPRWILPNLHLLLATKARTPE